MPSKPRRRPGRYWVVCWWMTGSFYGLPVLKADLVDAFSSVRNALELELRRDGAITRVRDWYMLDTQGHPEPAHWHESGEPRPRHWTRKYLVVWWMESHAHAIVFWSPVGGREWAHKMHGLLFEIDRRGKIRQAADFKFFDKDGKPQAIIWRQMQHFARPFSGPCAALVQARFPRCG